jgi:hypothetical protein
MIDIALDLLRSELGTFVSNRLQIPGDEPRVHMCPVVDEAGRTAVPVNTLGLSLINLEEDRVNQPVTSKQIADRIAKVSMPSKITAFVMLVANFKDYAEALKNLACVMEFVQSKPVLTPVNVPQMSDDIDQLTLQLCSYRLEELKDVWSFLGGRYHPSVVLKVKGIVIDAQQIQRYDERAKTFNIRKWLGT